MVKRAEAKQSASKKSTASGTMGRPVTKHMVKSCKFCSRTLGEGGVKKRREEGLECVTCPTVLVKRKKYKSLSKKVLLEKLQDAEFKKEFVEDIELFEATGKTRDDDETSVASDGPDSLPVSAAACQFDGSLSILNNRAQVTEQLIGYFWPDWLYKERKGKDLEPHQIQHCDHLGVLIPGILLDDRHGTPVGHIKITTTSKHQIVKLAEISKNTDDKQLQAKLWEGGTKRLRLTTTQLANGEEGELQLQGLKRSLEGAAVDEDLEEMTKLWGGGALGAKAIQNKKEPQPSSSSGRSTSKPAATTSTTTSKAKNVKMLDAIDGLLLVCTQTVNNATSKDTLPLLKPKALQGLIAKVVAKLTPESKALLTEDWQPGQEKTRGVQALDKLLKAHLQVVAVSKFDS